MCPAEQSTKERKQPKKVGRLKFSKPIRKNLTVELKKAMTLVKENRVKG